MNTIRVTKEFDFEAAHALEGYEGKCKNIHGHSYHLKVCVKGKVKKDDGASNDGMVVDFSILKTIVKRNVIEQFDHALLLKKDSPFTQIVNGSEPFEKLILTDFQPTCENMLVDIVQRIQPSLPSYLKLQHLFLRETANSYAEWYAEDNQ